MGYSLTVQAVDLDFVRNFVRSWDWLMFTRNRIDGGYLIYSDFPV